jgi:titin
MIIVNDDTMPKAPTDLQAVPGDTTVALTWTVSNHDDDDIEYYIVYRDGAEIARPIYKTYLDTGLTNGVTYVYTVAAHNDEGTGRQSYPVQSTPFALPGPPTDLQATPGDRQVELTWSAPVDDGGVAIDHYVVYRNEVDVGHPTTPSFTDTGLVNGVAHSYSVASYNAAEGPRSSAVLVTPFTVPGAPTNLQATPGNAQVSLSWTAPDDGGSAIDHYIVYRDGEAIDQTIDVSYVDIGLTNGASYSYTLAASNAAGTGPQSSPVQATPFTIPEAPSGLEATPGNAQVSLTWTAPDDGGSAIDHYIVYRDEADIGHPTAPSFTDTGLANGNTYTYTVAAHNAAGPSVLSSPAQATPQSVPGVPAELKATPGNGQAYLNWSPPLDDGGAAIDHYVVYRDGADIAHPTGLDHLDLGLVNGQTYSYTVAAHSTVGLGLQCAAVQTTPFTVPDAPTELVATPGNAHISLNWSAPGSDGGSSIDHYVVYRDGTDVGHSTALYFTDDELASGATYTYTVAAHNAAGLGARSSPAQATTFTVPEAPTGLLATPGDGQISLSWSAPASDGGAAIDNYVVYRGGVDVGHPTGTSFLDTGLTNGVTYSYTVAAQNVVGLGSQSSSEQATPLAVPSAPIDLQATPGNSQAYLTWSAPVDEGGSSIDYYVVYRNGADIAHPSTLYYTDTGLINGETYSYTVAAHTGAGLGLQSSAVQATPLTVPVAPTGLLASPGNAQVSLSWSAPSSNGGSAIDYYIIYRNGEDVGHPTALSFTDSGLTNGVSYGYTVAAHNAAGTGPQSASVPATPGTVPGAPTGLVPTPGNAQVSLTWLAPSSTGGSAIDYYVVYRNGEDVGHPTTLSFIDSGLINGVTYTYTVAAHNTAGLGAQSASVPATPLTVPGAPTGLLATPGNARVDLYWTAPGNNGGSVIDYYIVYRDGADVGHPTALSFIDVGLINGVTYIYTVAAHNAAGIGSLSTSAQAVPRTVPGAPTGLVATPGNAQVSLSWSAPSSNGGSVIDHYVVYRDGTDVGHPTALSFTDVGLTNGITYTYTVAAHNAAGLGASSSSVQSTPRTVPGVPTGLLATSGDAQVSLTWNAPSSNGGAAIDYYVVYRNGTDVKHSTALSFVDTGLANGVTYTYTVAAHNAAGTGATSAPVLAVPFTFPEAPSDLQATPGNAYIRLTWSAPGFDGGRTITSYQVWRGVSSGSETFLVNTGMVTWFNDTGLTNGQTYYYLVRAVNQAGPGERSSEASVIPSPDAIPPSAPLNLMATFGDGRVTLIWDPPANNGGSPITGYKVYRGSVPGGAAYLRTIANVEYIVDSGLVNGQIYYYSLSALSSAGEGGLSLEASATPAARPDAPYGLVAVPGNAQVHLEWSAPGDNGAPIVYYIVYRNGAKIGSPTETNYLSTDLTNGIKYTFAVAAANSAGIGPWSASASATPITVPEAPSALTASVGNGQVHLDWNAPMSDGGSSIDHYAVYLNDVEVGRTTISSFTLNNLTNGVSYDLTVAAHNVAGYGLPSISVEANPMTLPGAPTGLAAVRNGDQVTLTWDAPEDDGGSPIDYYVVYKDGYDLAHVMTKNYSYLELSMDTHVYAVAAHNAVGIGNMSEEVELLFSQVPGAPGDLHAEPGNLLIILTWSAPEFTGLGAITFHLFRDGTEVWSGAGQYYADTGLVKGVSHDYTVAASNDAGWGVHSAVVTAAAVGVPDAPGGLTAKIEDGGTSLSWNVPSYVGPGILTYHLYRDGVKIWTGSATSYVDPGELAEDEKHHYRVAASNAQGMGPSSEVVTVELPSDEGGWNLDLVVMIIAITVLVVATVALLVYLRRH